MQKLQVQFVISWGFNISYIKLIIIELNHFLIMKKMKKHRINITNV